MNLETVSAILCRLTALETKMDFVVGLVIFTMAPVYGQMIYAVFKNGKKAKNE